MNWLVEIIFPRRLHRVSYGIRILSSNILLFLLYGNNWLFAPGLCFLLMIFVIIYATSFIVLPRLRDVGMKWWLCLFCFLPGVNVVLGIILLLRAPKYPFGEPLVVNQKPE
jgi:uncharacterized membrane protein YhaH (DUF805 family)